MMLASVAPMLRYTIMIALALALVACASNQQDKDYYDKVEHGSSWQLALNATPCTIAVSTIGVDVPSGNVTGVPAGCTATLTFYLADDGDVTPSYDCSAAFLMTCNDGSSLECDQLICEDHQTMYCWSHPDRNAANNCELGASLDRIR